MLHSSTLWFLLAAFAPLLWAIVNILDEYLISYYYGKTSKKTTTKSSVKSRVGSLVLFSALFGIVVSAIVFIYRPEVVSLPLESILTLIISGACTVGWIIAYLIAIEKAGASSIVPWFQITPIFGFVTGFFFLHEIPTAVQIIGSLIIITGTVILSFDWSKRKTVFLGKPVWLMILASILVVISGALFKSVTPENDFWLSTFWEYAGIGITGIILFVIEKDYREDFLFKLKNEGKGIISINIINETVSSVGNIINNFAMLLVPVALVFSVNSIQPMYVLLLSIVVTKIWPKIGREKMTVASLTPKIIAIILVVIGSIIVSLSTKTS